jgi:DoxX-like family
MGRKEAISLVTSGNSARLMAGNVLIFLPGLALASSSILKFARVPAVVTQMAASGFADGKLVLVAILELLSAVLFLFPRTRSFGLLMLSGFLGGAICTHVQLGEYVKAVGPAIVLLMAWLGTWLRHPEVLWSAPARRPSTTHGTENENQSLPSRSA